MSAGGRNLPSWMPAALITGLVALAYANTLRAPFVFDDLGAVVNNPTIRSLASWSVLNPPADGSTTTGRPLVNLSFAFNYAISGEAVWSYHLVNAAIHAAAALVLYGVLRRTFASPAVATTPRASALWALATAALWAVHPLQTESVTSIAQRTESLCGLFYLLTLYAFLRGADGGARATRWFGVAVLACLAGMATKEVMVTAPVLVLLYDRTFLAGGLGRAWRQRGRWHLALAATWLLLAWLVMRGGGSRGAAAGLGLGVSTASYLLTQADALVLYLRLALWPYPLVFDYGTAVAGSLQEVGWQGVIVLALLAGTGWALWKRPALGFAGASFFLLLAPSSSVVPLVTQTIAEHRMYLPLAAVIAVGVLVVRQRFGERALGVLALLVIAGTAATIARNRDYRSERVLWQDTVEKRPTNPRAHNNLALVLQREGDAAGAHTHFARAVELDANYVSARYNWGVALLEQRRVNEAIAQFEAAVRVAPTHADAHLNLGNALVQTGRAEEALAAYERALRLRPAADAHFNLGVALAGLNRDEAAAREFAQALALEPALAAAHVELGRLAERSGRTAEAEAHYRDAVRVGPTAAGAHLRLGSLLARAGRLAEAVAPLERAVQLAPEDATALGTLGNVFLLQGRAADAVRAYEASLRLRPDDARTRQNLQLAREALQ